VRARKQWSTSLFIETAAKFADVETGLFRLARVRSTVTNCHGTVCATNHAYDGPPGCLRLP